MSLTAACGKVLVGQVEWQPMLMVGFGTYVVYNLDNLLDWPSEKHLLEAIKLKWNAYLIWCIFTIPLALVSALLLTVQSTFNLLALMGGLGTISVAHILLTRQSRRQGTSAIALWVEHLTDSLTWALVIVLIPVQYARQHIVAQVIMAVAYMWQMCWVGVMVWNLTNSVVEGQHQTQTLSALLGEHRLMMLLRIISVSSLVLAVVDIVLGYFPWYNVSVTAAPIVSLLLFPLWNRLRKTPRLYSSLFYMAVTLCSLLVIAVYALVE
jgi:hypothetical protein